jgi:hypothetical protein
MNYNLKGIYNTRKLQTMSLNLKIDQLIAKFQEVDLFFPPKLKVFDRIESCVRNAYVQDFLLVLKSSETLHFSWDHELY